MSEPSRRATESIGYASPSTGSASGESDERRWRIIAAILVIVATFGVPVAIGAFYYAMVWNGHGP